MIVYQMLASADEPVAMILPLPVAPGDTPHSLETTRDLVGLATRILTEDGSQVAETEQIVDYGYEDEDVHAHDYEDEYLNSIGEAERGRGDVDVDVDLDLDLNLDLNLNLDLDGNCNGDRRTLITARRSAPAAMSSQRKLI